MSGPLNSATRAPRVSEFSVDLIEMFVAALQHKYPDAIVRTAEEAKDAVGLAFKAGQRSVIDDTVAILRQKHGKFVTATTQSDPGAAPGTDLG